MEGLIRFRNLDCIVCIMYTTSLTLDLGHALHHCSLRISLIILLLSDIQDPNFKYKIKMDKFVCKTKRSISENNTTSSYSSITSASTGSGGNGNTIRLGLSNSDENPSSSRIEDSNSGEREEEGTQTPQSKTKSKFSGSKIKLTTFSTSKKNKLIAPTLESRLGPICSGNGDAYKKIVSEVCWREVH
jgi:hypothetical protein